MSAQPQTSKGSGSDLHLSVAAALPHSYSVHAFLPRMSEERSQQLRVFTACCLLDRSFLDRLRSAMSLSSDTALLLIDVQQGMDEPRWGTRNNPDAEQRIADLLAAWRATGRPVIHVQHLSVEPQSPLREDRPGHVFKVEAQPIAGEPVFQKHVNSAFIGTDLEAHLHANGIDALVVVGITTDHCVSSTTRMAGNLGFTVTVAEDATATFDRIGPDGTHYAADLMHRVTLASLHGEFATVRSTHDILADASA
jgi:nicotinamidase-related amidase